MKKLLSFHDIKQQLPNSKPGHKSAKVKQPLIKRNLSTQPAKPRAIDRSRSLSPNIALKTEKPSRAVVFMNKRLASDLKVT